jgi:hydroxyacylglutathione hydrolase/adenylyltransferase/sulfurtransferase
MAEHALNAEEVDVSPEQVAELGEDVQLIDVREPYEWEAGRIAGARHIEMQQVAAQAATIERERPVVFYCRVGSRSGMAANAFRRAGYEAYSMAGGLVAWTGRGLPLEPEDGTVAAH